MPSALQTNVLAFVALAALAAWLAVSLVERRRRLRLTWTQSFWYGVNYLVCRILWRARVDQTLPVGPDAGAVIVANHRSSIDPCFIEIATNRVVHWMVAKEYFAYPGLGRFLRLAQSIPTSRGGIDTQATKMAIRYAENGGLVGIFPEGRINRTPHLLLPGRSGAALIALKARVPVVPCYIEGAPYDGTALGSLLMPAKVTVQLGQPLDFSAYYGRENEREVLELVTRRMLTAIATLAGQPDFQPQLAGRMRSAPAEVQAERRNGSQAQ